MPLLKSRLRWGVGGRATRCYCKKNKTTISTTYQVGFRLTSDNGDIENILNSTATIIEGLTYTQDELKELVRTLFPNDNGKNQAVHDILAIPGVTIAITSGSLLLDFMFKLDSPEGGKISGLAPEDRSSTTNAWFFLWQLEEGTDLTAGDIVGWYVRGIPITLSLTDFNKAVNWDSDEAAGFGSDLVEGQKVVLGGIKLSKEATLGLWEGIRSKLDATVVSSSTIVNKNRNDALIAVNDAIEALKISDFASADFANLRTIADGANNLITDFTNRVSDSENLSKNYPDLNNKFESFLNAYDAALGEFIYWYNSTTANHNTALSRYDVEVIYTNANVALSRINDAIGTYEAITPDELNILDNIIFPLGIASLIDNILDIRLFSEADTDYIPFLRTPGVFLYRYRMGITIDLTPIFKDTVIGDVEVEEFKSALGVENSGVDVTLTDLWGVPPDSEPDPNTFSLSNWKAIIETWLNTPSSASNDASSQDDGTMTEENDENTPSSPATSPREGTINHTKGNDIIVVGLAEGNQTHRGLEGDDTYILSNANFKGGYDITIVDNTGNNIIQLVNGLVVKQVNRTVNNIHFKLPIEETTDATVTITSSDKYTYEIGGDETRGEVGTKLEWNEFLEALGGEESIVQWEETDDGDWVLDSGFTVVNKRIVFNKYLEGTIFVTAYNTALSRYINAYNLMGVGVEYTDGMEGARTAIINAIAIADDTKEEVGNLDITVIPNYVVVDGSQIATVYVGDTTTKTIAELRGNDSDIEPFPQEHPSLIGVKNAIESELSGRGITLEADTSDGE